MQKIIILVAIALSLSACNSTGAKYNSSGYWSTGGVHNGRHYYPRSYHNHRPVRPYAYSSVRHHNVKPHSVRVHGVRHHNVKPHSVRSHGVRHHNQRPIRIRNNHHYGIKPGHGIKPHRPVRSNIKRHNSIKVRGGHRDRTRDHGAVRHNTDRTRHNGSHWTGRGDRGRSSSSHRRGGRDSRSNSRRRSRE